jgi:hypothetical protein
LLAAVVGRALPVRDGRAAPDAVAHGEPFGGPASHRATGRAGHCPVRSTTTVRCAGTDLGGACGRDWNHRRTAVLRTAVPLVSSARHEGRPDPKHRETVRNSWQTPPVTSSTRAFQTEAPGLQSGSLQNGPV